MGKVVEGRWEGEWDTQVIQTTKYKAAVKPEVPRGMCLGNAMMVAYTSTAGKVVQNESQTSSST